MSATAGGNRIIEIDALRGFALFGILMVNIAFFASAYPLYGIEDPMFTSALDRGVRWVVALLFETKFYLLFSFLFGYSFTLQRADTPSDFTARWLRRLAGLFVIGAAHAVLLFHGDILTTYAIAGLILLTLQRVSPRALVITGCALILLTATQLAYIGLAVFGGRDAVTDHAAALAGAARSTEALSAAGSVISEHLASLPQMMQAFVAIQGPTALAAFLVGLIAGRRKWLADAASCAGLPVLQWVGFPVGLAGAFAYVTLGGSANLLAIAISLVTAPFLCAAYIATLLRFFRTAPGQRLACKLAPAGRMALTNYVGQSLLCSLIFTGYGLALIGQLSPAAVLLVVFGIFSVQVWFSRIWLDEHTYGPLEWLLRTVTYAAPPPWLAPKQRERVLTGQSN